ncbi:TBC1 domain family member 5 A like [Actinidia chinensis var. chinensis]|uniref:TBC1 domain family member 5 A like n=1 Tax=Actinidia chinensis var. chinensis TaxID=1590841 RepID=A0A2R6Q381_ACTCC|nr:TBC1 domain family member 5 A like [Actinidia chinensis var. chinensis]
MSPVAPIEPTLKESSSVDYSPTRLNPEGSAFENRRFADLRGVRWRIDLGILPDSSSIDDLRRVTADSRRRYAGLRRRLLIDPHIHKDGSNSPDLVMDNPLSQNPDSMWGRFFRNAELERMVDQDLSRLYPEHGSYFQTPGCQSMLRRILLFWCLIHTEYGYRQGMHELLAPLLYILHTDVERLSQVRKLYEDHFIDKFDGISFHESDLTYNFDFKKFPESADDGIDSQISPLKVCNLDELDPRIQDTILLSDAYGAEGELGIVLSEKFMEHDAYSMFDGLMSGAGGAVAMAEFFSPLGGSHTGLPPVIEASSTLYHLLSTVDASLYSHLVELGVEPQYFALRWLRVLFGREFSLEDLLVIWDQIFACDNTKLNKCSDDVGSSFGVLSSARGAFISAIAVSMILHMRSSLLATENATSCLQRLLNFPSNINLKKILAKAKSLQVLALDLSNSTPLLVHPGSFEPSKSVVLRGHSLSSDCISPRTPLSLVPESYWEGKWRDLNKAEELKQSSSDKQVPDRKKGWSEKVRFSLSRTESAPSPSKVGSSKKDPKLSVRRNLLEDLSRQLGLEEDSEKLRCNEDLGPKDRTSMDAEVHGQDSIDKNNSSAAEERCLIGNAGSEENDSIFSDSPSPNDDENQSERSSVASNLSIDENEDESNNVESCRMHVEESPLPVSDSPEDASWKSGLNRDSVGKTTARLDSSEDVSLKSGQDNDTTGKPVAAFKERKLLSGKFQWFWKFGRNNGEGTSERGVSEATKAPNSGRDQNNAAASLMVNGSNNSSVSSKGDAVDQNVMITLRNLGQSMLENIQVIESAFQQDRGQAGSLENFSKNVLVGKGQVTAMSALKELRKISNLLSEM